MKNYVCLNPDCGESFDEPLSAYGWDNCPHCHSVEIAINIVGIAMTQFGEMVPQYSVGIGECGHIVYCKDSGDICICSGDSGEELARKICDMLNNPLSFIGTIPDFVTLPVIQEGDWDSTYPFLDENPFTENPCILCSNNKPGRVCHCILGSPGITITAGEYPPNILCAPTY